ncbi:LOW QUALITY PROTEIN: neuroglian-like [Palaemon carinicauda]|uniref:LOW QUALITY PROTEIN: neuroglian-like n=1 Tax=Palaemon carinicauda TaxID=392227 RepID=UPI0035B5CF41
MLEPRHSRMGSGLLLTLLALAAMCEAVIKYPPMMTKQPPSNEELLFQVASRQDENDKPFIIECEAEGEPAPKYRWVKNGKDFDWQTYDNRISQQPGRGTLVITSPRDEDLGQYQCFATNEMGTATSNSVFVRKSELNNFKNEDPVTIQVNEGEPAQLKCQPPDGYPKPYVYWMIQDDRGALRSINSSRMTVDPEGSLFFSNVTRFDESNDFTYACSATSTFRNEYKLGNRVYLRVYQSGSTAVQTKNEPKQQFVSRKNTVILKGKTLQLWCIFSGTPLPEMRWKKSNNSVAVNLPIERVDYENYGKTLVIRYVDFEDEGQYECEASNGVGVAKSYSMNVQVQAIPYFEKEPEVENKAEGETAVFYCEAGGRPPPDHRWIYNGMPITLAPSNPRRFVESNKITIYNLTKEDTGNYGCNATNEHGYVYKDVYINVLALPPEIRAPPSDVSSVDGKEVNMTCRVFGAPKPRITWLRDKSELTGGRYQVTESGDLVIKDVTFTDAGNYVCHAENKFGMQSAEGSLIVKKRTEITEKPEDYEVAAGQTATFRCNAVTDSDLELSIEWLTDGKNIDFEQEPRFVQQSDSSLSITKTTELDSGVYTCVASTELDEVTASATLIVQDVPNPPVLLPVACNDRDASVEWQPMGDNRAPILGYIIQFNTSFTPDTWENAFDSVPATSTQFNINLSPWANYTFRVIARNKIGPSLPSDHSGMCTTPQDVPYKNPDGVEGKGSTPQNLVIKWSPMPEIDHNGPGFKYRVYYKRADIENSQYQTYEVTNWEQDHFIVPNQPTFKQYRIKVEAHNDKGQAHVAAPEYEGWSGEDVPNEAPTNLTLVELRDATTALLSWNPVSPESVRGHFKGYKIQTWTESESEDKARDIIVENNDEPRALVTSFVPFTKNYVRVLVFNGAYDGPPSESLSFVTPEGQPGPVDSLDAIPMGSSAFFLIWKKPKQPNGIVTGYHIYYQEVDGTNTGITSERDPPIRDQLVTRAKLASLKPATKYRITIRAATEMGQGFPYYIERTTRAPGADPPGKPSFIWQHISTKTGIPAIKITWIPNTETNPGSHFYVKYKLFGESMFQETKPELYQDFTVLEGLEENQAYQVCVVAVDGEFSTESDIEEIDTHSSVGSAIYKGPTNSIATRGWFIGMMLAIAFLLLILIIVCIVKRNRGGKYAVHEREAAHGRTDFNEEQGFPEFAQPLDGAKRDSLGSDVKNPIESDTDSMAEYGDGDTGRFTEDGSFIGQYGGATGKRKPAAEDKSPSAVATFV